MAMVGRALLIPIVLWSCSVHAYIELVSKAHWNFEQPDPTHETYKATGGCDLELRTDDGYKLVGDKSAYIANRDKAGSTVSMYFNGTEPNAYYFVSTYVHPIGIPAGKIGNSIKLTVQEQDSNGVSLGPALTVCTLKYANDQGFSKLSGDLKTSSSTKQLVIKPMVEDSSIPFYVDDTELFQVMDEPGGWEAAADKRIEEFRKGEITINVTLNVHTEACGSRKKEDYELEVRQVRNSFKFGVGTDVGCLCCQPHCLDAIKEFGANTIVYRNEQKWMAMDDAFGIEKARIGADTAMELGFDARGHTALWQRWDRMISAVNDSYVANDLQKMIDLVDERVEVVSTVLRGKLLSMDMSNEYQHGRCIEEARGITDSSDLIRWTKTMQQIDPDVHVCTNEYAVLAGSGRFMQGNLNTLQRLGDHPDIDASRLGAGMQSHFFERLDSTLLGRRLEYFANSTRPGMPLYLSEMTVSNLSEDETISFYKELYKQAYSRPGVAGIMFWAMNNETINQADYRSGTLTNGPLYQFNRIGESIRDLLRSWMTTRTLDVGNRDDVRFKNGVGTATVRGFHGDYEINLVHKSYVNVTGDLTEIRQIVATEPVSLRPGQSAFVSIEV